MKPDNFSPALLVVDMQNDFCPPSGSLAVPNGRDTIPVINDLLRLKSWTVRIATKDFHPQDHTSFASNHSGAEPFTSFATIVNPENPNESYETRLWPDHCVQGTTGSELVEGLDPEKRIEAIIEKGKDPRVEMYSAFYDPFLSPRISDSGLAAKLKDEYKVTWVYVVGLALDYCVKACALDARREGFEVVVIRDGTRAVDRSEEKICAVEEELERSGVKVVNLDSSEVEWLMEQAIV